MQIVLIGLGAVALVPALIAVAVLVSMWRAWWLHPLWGMLLVPLGVPAIGYWQFLALGMFFHSWLAWKAQGESGSEKKDKTRTIAQLFVILLWPIMTFYFVSWYLS